MSRNNPSGLQVEVLEDRTAPASLNAQYVVELQTHPVAFGFDHLSILLTPQNPSLYHDDDGDGHADEDPLFVRRSDGSYALSLGAGPSLGPLGGTLIAAFNRENDIDIHPAAQRHTLTKPAGYADSRAWANALISRSAGYGDNLGYDFFPETTGNHNSNSFVAGLLNATGTTVANPATIFAGGDYPGYATPVPTAAFGTTPARRIDLVFVIDTTGSMFDDIAAVKSSATQIINDVHARFRVDGAVDARIAVMDYRDFPTPPYGGSGDYPFHDVQRFTSNPATAVSGIQALRLGFGGDLPESVFSGLMHAIQSPSLGSWRGEGVSKVIILMGDAPGHNPEPFTGFTTNTVITAAENEDPVVIFPVAIGNFNTAQFQAIATGTAGQLIRAANASTIVSALQSAIGAIARTPVAEAGGPYTGVVGVPVALSAAGSFDPDGTIVRYEWDWESDGTYDTTTVEPTVSHTWTAPFTGRVRLRVVDNEGLTSLDFADVTVRAAAPPTDIALSNDSVAENEPPGTLVGTFSTTDPDVGDTFSYALVSGSGDDDNAAFTLDASGNLKTAAAFDFEGKPSYSIRARSTDAVGLYFEKVFEINVTNVNEAPTLTVPADQTAFEDVDKGISALGVGDVDSDSLTVSLAVGHGALTLGTTTGLGVSGNGTAFVSLSGSITDLNAALATLVYRASLNFSGADALNITASDGSLSTSGSVAITVKSAAQQAADLQARVNALRDAGVLNRGQANSLTVKLNLHDNNGDAGKVRSFLNHVEAFLNAGILTQEQADDLLSWGNILLLSVTRR